MVISTHLTRFFISKLSPSLAYLNVMDNCLGIGDIDVAPADPIALGGSPRCTQYSTDSSILVPCYKIWA